MVHATNAVATLSGALHPSLDPAYSYSGITGQRSDREPLDFEQVDHFAAEMDDFAQCIINYRPRTRISDVQRQLVKKEPPFFRF